MLGSNVQNKLPYFSYNFEGEDIYTLDNLYKISNFVAIFKISMCQKNKNVQIKIFRKE